MKPKSVIILYIVLSILFIHAFAVFLFPIGVFLPLLHDIVRYDETSAKHRMIIGLTKIKLKMSLKRHKIVEYSVWQGSPYPCSSLI